MINNTTLNRIKIKDMMAAIRKDINADTPFGLIQLELLDRKEKWALENATNEDLRKIEKFFIENKLGVKYYPSQNRKVLNHGKVVQIDEKYE